MPYAIFAACLTVHLVIFYLWFSKSTRENKIAFDTLMANPEQVEDFWRSGPDGDGYNRLTVRTKNGAILVIGHFEADDAEKRLHAACDKKSSDHLDGEK